MKRHYFLLLIGVTIVSCSTEKSILEDGKTYQNFRGFEPTDPTEYDEKIPIVIDNAFVNKEIKLLSPDQIFSFLNNETVLVSIGQITKEGGITYLPVTLSAKGSSYKITMDYMKFATIGQIDDDGEFIGYKRVGVGLRLISNITTFEAGINIGDLSSIGLAAKAGKLNGTLMIEVIGIKSKEVTTLLPLPSEINQTTIQNAMQALATIKSKIYDTDTKLFPQVMAVKAVEHGLAKTEAKSSEAEAKSNEKYVAGNNSGSVIENKVKLQFDNNKATSANTQGSAGKLVSEGFQLLFDKDIEKAIAKFDECERAFPQYYSVFEIKQLLVHEKDSLKDKGSKKWKEVYSTILDRYSWKLSAEIKDGLKRGTAQ
jgi:hypothetical protein